MLLSCDVRSLDATTLALLTNDGMLAIFNDKLGAQAKRLHTGAGSATPQQLTFETCPSDGEAPLPRQTWTLDASTGRIVSEAFPKRAITMSNCGLGKGAPRLVLCSLDPETAPNPPGQNCRNTSCPTANTFALPATAAAEWETTGGLITSKLSGGCIEGMLGPQRSSVVVTPKCDKANIKQLCRQFSHVRLAK